MDPLSQVLAVLQLRTFQAGSFMVNSGTKLSFRPHQGIKCYTVIFGRCCVVLDGSDGATELEQGDCVLLASGRPFVLATDLSAKVQPFTTDLVRPASRQMIGREEGSASLLGGHFVFANSQADLLLRELPALLQVRQQSGQRVMLAALEGMAQELENPQPGGSLVAEQFSSLLLIQALRQHLQNDSDTTVGWLAALTDAQLRPVIEAMHRDPKRSWSLQDLVSVSGMSRTVFAQRFRARCGITAMAYLMRWRMLVAGEQLQATSSSIAQVALSVGYEAESAFGRAFKKVWHCSPKQHRQIRSKGK